jgi:hypothetical protein
MRRGMEILEDPAYLRESAGAPIPSPGLCPRVPGHFGILCSGHHTRRLWLSDYELMPPHSQPSVTGYSLSLSLAFVGACVSDKHPTRSLVSLRGAQYIDIFAVFESIDFAFPIKLISRRGIYQEEEMRQRRGVDARNAANKYMLPTLIYCARPQGSKRV